jgi:WD40 repeat protein
MTPAHVTTFYSFKGGVGRTVLLANVGAFLARTRKVLLWDLDLEAPGLHLIPAVKPARLLEAGFLEWMLAWQRSGTPAELDDASRAALRAAIRPAPGNGNLHVLPAFGDRADFASVYQDIHWHAHMVEHAARGIALFRAALAVVAEGYDHVLIDARTGITDVGGLAAALLPDVTVLVGSFAHQNTYGLLHVKRALEPVAAGHSAARGDAANLELLLVASPVPADEAERVERRAVWLDLFKQNAFAEVPFDPRLIAGERLLVNEDEASGAARAYRQVAERIAGSAVDKLTRAEPADVADAEPGPRFLERVARLLAAAGFDVRRPGEPDGSVDLYAERPGVLGPERFVVVCRAGRVTEVDAPGSAPGEGTPMLLAERLTAPARERARELGVAAFTVRELEQRLLDFTPALQKLRAEFEARELARTYVPQRLEREADPNHPVDLLPHAHAWARGEGSPLWLVLGDYGTGKSVFVQRFAYELALRALADPEAPVPLAVDLRRFPNAISLEGLVQEHLRAEMGWHGNPSLVLHLLSVGRVVLLLDAFDEMGAAALGRSVEEQFRLLASRAGDAPFDEGGNRVLVTCRAHFFRDQQQVKDAVGPAPAVDSPLGAVARTYAATIDELALFTPAQIDAFLVAHLGEPRAGEARAFIDRTYDLRSLARQPVLLEIITRSLPRLVEQGGAMNVARLYDLYTRQWLDDRSGGTLQTKPEHRERLLRRLAHHLWGAPERRVHHRDLLTLLRSWPAELFVGLDLDRVDLELRTAAFLTRSADGHYRFSHKSFLEFFLARFLVDTNDLAGALATEPLTPEVARFVAELAMEHQNPLAADLAEILRSAYRPKTSENALRLCAWMGGAWLRDLVPDAAQLSTASLHNLDLGGVRLVGADLRYADLQGTNLYQANLHGSRLDHAACGFANFYDADLGAVSAVGTDFSNATMREASLTDARLDHATLVQADLREASLSGASLHGADLRDGLLAWADLSEVDWTDAGLVGVTAPGCVGPPPPGVRPVPPRLLPLLGSRGALFDVAPSAAADRLLAVGNDGTARILDAHTGRLLRVLHGDGEALCDGGWGPGDGLVFATSATGGVYVWDTLSGERIGRLRLGVGTGAPGAAVWLPGDAGELPVLAASVSGGNAGLWIPGAVGPFRSLPVGAEDRVTVLGVSADGNVLAAGPAAGGGLRVFDLRRNGWVHLDAFADPFAVAVSPDGSAVAVADEGAFGVWERTGARRWRNEQEREVLQLRFTPDGSGLVVTTEDGLAVFDTGTGAPAPSAVIGFVVDGTEIFRASAGSGIADLLGQPARPTATALTRPNAGTVWLGYAPFGARSYNVRTTGTPGAAREGGAGNAVVHLAVSPDRAWMARAASGRTELWRPGEAGTSLTGTTTGLAWHASGDLVRTTRTFLERVEPGTGRVVWRIRLRGGRPRLLAASSTVVFMGGDDTTIAHDAATGLLRWSTDGSTLTAATFSPDERTLFAVGDALHVLDAATGTVRRSVTLLSRAHALDLSEDAELLLTAGEDGVLRVWTAEGYSVAAHPVGSPVTHAYFDGNTRAVTLHPDGAVRYWDLDSGTLIRTFLNDIASGGVTVEADGRWRGHGRVLEALTYCDPDEVGPFPTTWRAVDLPELRLPD